MNKLMKRALAFVMVLVICLSFLPILQIKTGAANVNYTYDGTYIYNWGERGVTATFMSPNAEAFYTGTKAYETLSAYSGGTGTSDAPTSSLYSALKTVMKDAHRYETSYDATRQLYKYTDCQKGGGAISSFYSGKSIGPAWDSGSTWNREHTWPNSKGLGGNDENDIMMLRPTASSENSSRSNDAYGVSAGYYNPNGESGGQYDVRGDVARIFLYVYVRWGNVNGNGEYATWGSRGVIESLDVLLDWMEADPVDTWELGRNDSVQSITGTRNVFVDYPELAFLLFGAEVPKDMATPSGQASNKCEHNNFDSGKVTQPTCTEDGYTLYTCQTSGCGCSYRANIVVAKGHSYANGACTACGAAEPAPPVKPTYATSIAMGTPYKLGIYSTAKATEFYFSGTMNEYYGATVTDYSGGVDVYAENASGGFYLYFMNSANQKQYINLVVKDTYRNFTFSSTATSVFAWDSTRNSPYTTLDGEICYIGTYGTYVTMGVLRSSKISSTDYFARLYTMNESSGDTSCQHKYTETVTGPTCLKGGYTTCVCSLCSHTYVKNEVPAKGHSYTNGICTTCGAVKPSGTEASISFADTANRTVLNNSQQVWVQNGITVTNNKNTSDTNVANYSNPARFYMGSEVTVAYPGMLKLEIDCTGLESKYVNGWLNVTGATATNNGGIVTVVFDSPKDSFTYPSLSAQSRAYGIKVYVSVEAACTHATTRLEGALQASCTTDGYTGDTVCLACGTVTAEGEVIPAAHKIVPHAAKEPTCTEKGWNAYDTCMRCNYNTYTERATVAHDFEEWEESEAPTCTESGKETRECKNCGHLESRKAEALGHVDTNADGLCDMCAVRISPDTSTGTGDGTNTEGAQGSNTDAPDEDNGHVAVIVIASVGGVSLVGAGAAFFFIRKKRI